MFAFINLGLWEIIGLGVVGLGFVVTLVVVLVVVLPSVSKPAQPHDRPPPAS
ncbi:MAG: hypothetical protein K8I27_00615 [Planctomycetes bacterium]|nr:hypothetical protein [Planctomycetota bacterium]